MEQIYKFFVNDESGAVTVDWVVLTAGIVGLALAAVASAQNGIDALAGAILDRLESIEVPNDSES